MLNLDQIICLGLALVGSLLFGFGAGGLYLEYKENVSLFFVVVGFLIAVFATFALSALAD